MEQLLNEREAAKLLRISVQLLRKWRANGTGPEHIKLGVRYSTCDIERYISAQRSGAVSVRAGHAEHAVRFNESY
jgi:hypothetical protein